MMGRVILGGAAVLVALSIFGSQVERGETLDGSAVTKSATSAAVSSAGSTVGTSTGTVGGLLPQTQTVTKEEIVAQATDASYKDLLRHPENYTNEYVVLSVDLNQIYEKTYYFCYSNAEDSGMYYYGDVYCILDKRVDDDEKLLESDALTVYGKFTGLREFTNTNQFTGGEEVEMPVVEMLYVDISDE